MITETLLNKFLVFLYQGHIEEHGDSIASLPKGGVHVLDKPFPSESPDAVINLDEETIKDLTPNLAKELQARGLAEYESLVVTLTPYGFEKAQSLSNPVKYFLTKQWKWYIPAIICILAAFTTIIRLMKWS